MRLQCKLGLLLAATIFASSAGAGNLWPPRGYDKGVISEWNEMLERVVPATVDDQMPRYYALMHVAMFDAINSIERKSPALQSQVAAPRSASTDAAAAQAAHDVLIALFPANALELNVELQARLATINPARAQLGVAVGREVAQRTLRWASRQKG